MMPISLTYADLVRLIRVSIGAALLVAIGILLLRWSDLQVTPLKVLLQTAFTAIGIPPPSCTCILQTQLDSTMACLVAGPPYGSRVVVGGVIYRFQVRGRANADGTDTNRICGQTDLFLSIYSVVYPDAARTLDARDLSR